MPFLQLYALASEKAAAAGLCHRSNNPVCSTQAVVQWAQSVVLSKQKLLQLSGALKLYTKALAGLIPIQNEQHNWAAAAEVARYLGYPSPNPQNSAPKQNNLLVP